MGSDALAAAGRIALAQALLDLISSDKLDADTWDDFEATLIGSDLGVGPTGELVDSLRKELSIDGVADPARAQAMGRAGRARAISDFGWDAIAAKTVEVYRTAQAVHGG